MKPITTELLPKTRKKFKALKVSPKVSETGQTKFGTALRARRAPRKCKSSTAVAPEFNLNQEPEIQYASAHVPAIPVPKGRPRHKSAACKPAGTTGGMPAKSANLSNMTGGSFCSVTVEQNTTAASNTLHERPKRAPRKKKLPDLNVTPRIPITKKKIASVAMKGSSQEAAHAGRRSPSVFRDVSPILNNLCNAVHDPSLLTDDTQCSPLSITVDARGLQTIPERHHGTVLDPLQVGGPESDYASTLDVPVGALNFMCAYPPLTQTGAHIDVSHEPTSETLHVTVPTGQDATGLHALA